MCRRRPVRCSRPPPGFRGRRSQEQAGQSSGLSASCWEAWCSSGSRQRLHHDMHVRQRSSPTRRGISAAAGGFGDHQETDLNEASLEVAGGQLLRVEARRGAEGVQELRCARKDILCVSVGGGNYRSDGGNMCGCLSIGLSAAPGTATVRSACGAAGGRRDASPPASIGRYRCARSSDARGVSEGRRFLLMCGAGVVRSPRRAADQAAARGAGPKTLSF